MTDTGDRTALFVVSCPTCGGWSATGTDMVGQAACCPLCAAAFLVPTPATDIPAPSVPGASPPAAPVSTQPITAAPAPAAPAPATPAPAAQIPTTHAPAAPTPASSFPTQELPTQEFAGPSLPASQPAAVAAPAPPFIDQPPAQVAVAEPWADLDVPQPAVPGGTGNAELQFQEHARTVGSGPDAVQLRRLTPEERESRRRRRNFIMLLTGGAILVAIAIRYGVSTGVKRRR